MKLTMMEMRWMYFLTEMMVEVARVKPIIQGGDGIPGVEGIKDFIRSAVKDKVDHMSQEEGDKS